MLLYEQGVGWVDDIGKELTSLKCSYVPAFCHTCWSCHGCCLHPLMCGSVALTCWCRRAGSASWCKAAHPIIV